MTSTMHEFEYNANPGRVLFGHGTIAKLPAELVRQSLHRPLLLSTPEQVSQANDLSQLLLQHQHQSSTSSTLTITVAGIFAQATMHTPTHITEQARAYAQAQGADCLVSVGGGSTIGLGKAVSLGTGLPHLCIPTTYAGSEMTPILGETADGVKTTRNDPRILPGTVIYDVDLTMTLPVRMSAVSGVNAIAHAVEALYARNTNPIINLLAIEGTRALATALPLLTKLQDTPTPTPSSSSSSSSLRSARAQALYGAWLCGTCLGSVGMSLHHKLCHTLGGALGLPHAETHTAVLPHALAYNAPALDPTVLAQLASALLSPSSSSSSSGSHSHSHSHPQGEEKKEEGEDAAAAAIRGVNVLLEQLGVQRALKDFGMREEDIDRAADLAVANPYWNPRAVERAPVRELLRRVWAGEPARADL